MSKLIKNIDLELEWATVDPVRKLLKYRGETLEMCLEEFQDFFYHPKSYVHLSSIVTAQLVLKETTWIELLCDLEEGVVESFTVDIFGVEVVVIKGKEEDNV